MKQTVWKTNKNGSSTIYVPANQTELMRWIIWEGEAGLWAHSLEHETDKELYETLAIDTKKPWFGMIVK
jgi:PAB1-binding protein PBP1